MTFNEEMVGVQERVTTDEERLLRRTCEHIARLTGCKNFVGKREFIFNAFGDLEPMERFENKRDMCEFRSLNNSMNPYEPVKLIVWKVLIEIIAVVKFRMENGGSNCVGFLKSGYGRSSRM